jgi:hypothetical protein
VFYHALGLAQPTRGASDGTPAKRAGQVGRPSGEPAKRGRRRERTAVALSLSITVLTGMGKEVFFGHFLGIKKH